MHPEQQVAQWYTAALSSREANELIGHIRFARVYGVLASYAHLPEEAKVILRAAYKESQQEAR